MAPKVAVIVVHLPFFSFWFIIITILLLRATIIPTNRDAHLESLPLPLGAKLA